MESAIVITPRAGRQWAWARAGEVAGSGSLQALANWYGALDGPTKVVLLVPGEDVLLAEVSMPTRNPSRIARALPYALEEHILGDPSSLHCVPGCWRSRETLSCAAIGRGRLEAWLEDLAGQGITPGSACPDTLCVPWTEGTIQVVSMGRRVLVRWGECAAAVVEDTSLDALIQGLRAGSGSGDGTVERHEFPNEDAFLAGCAARADAPPLNLLQGPFLPAQSRAGWRSWRLAAALTLGVLLAAVLLEGLQIRELGRQSGALSQAITAEFRSAFPHVSRVQSDPGPQVELELRRLRQEVGAGQDRFLTLLSRAAPALAASPGLRLERLQYRDGQLELGLTAGRIAELDALRARLQGVGVMASQGAARLDNERVSGTITISTQGSEADR
jgi:general secretion pathway protein L